MNQPLSLRLPEATSERLSARARHRHLAPRTLAQRYVEEGLRMDDHPLVRHFRPLHAELIARGSAGHPGFVFVPTTHQRTRADIGRMVTALEAKLADYPGEQDLANGETWL